MLDLQNDFRCFDWIAAEKNENSTSHDLLCCLPESSALCYCELSVLRLYPVWLGLIIPLKILLTFS